jgi:hypothetical protein
MHIISYTISIRRLKEERKEKKVRLKKAVKRL